jgi:hypothetical protein
MTANTGRTHEIYTQFWLDNAAGTLVNLSAYLVSVGAVGLNHETADVTGLSNGVKNFLTGHPSAPLTVVLRLDTVVITQLSALVPNTPLSLGIYYGIRHAWESGEPTFGLSSSATSGYIITGFSVSGTDVTATFEVFGPTAPAWGTAAIT